MKITIQDNFTGQFAPAIVDATNGRFALEADIDFASDSVKTQGDTAELDRFLRFLEGVRFEPCFYAEIEEFNGYDRHQMVGSTARITAGDCDADFDWDLEYAFTSRTFRDVTPHGTLERSVEKFLAQMVASAHPDGKIPGNIRHRVNNLSNMEFEWASVAQERTKQLKVTL